MCVVSMVIDHQYDRWYPKLPPIVEPSTVPFPPAPGYFPPPVKQITQEEIDDFRKLLEKAREYDKRHNQPDCELDAKRKKIRALAKKLGVDISFV